MDNLKNKLKLLQENYNNKSQQLYSKINQLNENKTQDNNKANKNIDKKITNLYKKIDSEYNDFIQKKEDIIKEIKKYEKKIFDKQFKDVNYNKQAEKNILKKKYKKDPQQVREILEQEWKNKKSECPNSYVVLKYEHYEPYNLEWEKIKEKIYKYPKDFFPISKADLQLPLQNKVIFFQDVEGLRKNLDWIKKQEMYIQDLPPESIQLLIEYSSDEKSFIGIKNFWKQKKLKSIIENSPPLEADLMVYRGISNDYFPKKDKMFLNKRFISTTYALHASFKFMGGVGCCIIQILLPKGTRCIFMPIISVYREESEILLPISTTFKIINKNISSLNDTWKLNQSPESYPFQKKIIKAKIPNRFASFIFKYFGITL